MFSREEYITSLFGTHPNIDKLSIQLFHYQYKSNKIYQEYLKALKFTPNRVKKISDIPYLPISLFKTHKIQSGNYKPKLVFESSGTTQTTPSQHLVKEPSIYEKSFRKGFSLFYDNIKDYVVIGLLPSYLERKNASLVYMVNDFIQQSQHKESGFYLNEYEKLFQTLTRLEQENKKILLIGVTFGLLDFVDKYKMQLKHTIIMETGGMKGRRKELTREEVHHRLMDRLGVKNIHSEYGMTELLSQAYSKGKGRFRSPPWMTIFLRDINDPLSLLAAPETGKKTSGVINIMDLANIDSCAFIATDDLGILYPDGSFEVRGRRDSSDLRGCSLMAI